MANNNFYKPNSSYNKMQKSTTYERSEEKPSKSTVVLEFAKNNKKRLIWITIGVLVLLAWSVVPRLMQPARSDVFALNADGLNAERQVLLNEVIIINNELKIIIDAYQERFAGQIKPTDESERELINNELKSLAEKCFEKRNELLIGTHDAEFASVKAAMLDFLAHYGGFFEIAALDNLTPPGSALPSLDDETNEKVFAINETAGRLSDVITRFVR